MSNSRIGHYRGAVPSVPGCASGGILPGKYQTLNLRYLTEARQGLCTGLGPYSPPQGIVMSAAQSPETLRRSSRVPVAVPVLVSSLEPNSGYSEMCETMVVSAHGCAIKTSTPLEPGAPVHFQTKQGRHTTAHVVDCQPLNSGQRGWKVAAKLDQPQNLWGLEGCPDDWKRWLVTEIFSDQSPRADLRVSNLNSLVTQLLEPLQTEVTELREKLAQGTAKRSNFDISLTHIPEEVEEKLWLRLREDLGAQVLEQTREQSERVLGAAKQIIDQKIGTAQQEFKQHVTQELRTVERKAQSLSEEIADSLQQHMNTRVERFHQHVSEAGLQLERHSEEFLRGLQQRLADEYDAYRREMQRAHAEATAESTRLQAQITELNERVGRLDEAALRLESQMESHLNQVAHNIIAAARTQLETAVESVLKELGTRNAKELGHQLDQACGKLEESRKSIEASVSELIKTEVAGSLLSFGQTMEELAQDSVGRWRMALARDLNSVARTLGQNFQMKPEASENEGLSSEN